MKNAAEFIKQAGQDSALKAKLKAAIDGAGSKDGEIDAAVKVAKDAGYDVPADEMKALVVGAKRQAGELSDDELEKVAGGGVMEDVGGGMDSAVGGVETAATAIDSGVNAAQDWASDAANDVASFFSSW